MHSASKSLNDYYREQQGLTLSVFYLSALYLSIKKLTGFTSEEVNRMEVYTDTPTDILPITGSASCVQSFDDSLVVQFA